MQELMPNFDKLGTPVTVLAKDSNVRPGRLHSLLFCIPSNFTTSPSAWDSCVCIELTDFYVDMEVLRCS